MTEARYQLATCYRCGHLNELCERFNKRLMCKRCISTVKRIERNRRQLKLFDRREWRPRS